MKTSITPEERQTAKAIGLDIPGSSCGLAEAEPFAVDWDDLRSFKAEVLCPYCKAPQTITEQTQDEIACSGCSRLLEVELGEITVEANVLLRPTLSKADREYLAWKRERGAA